MTIVSAYEAFTALRNDFLVTVLTAGERESRDRRARHAIEGSIKFADAYALWQILDASRPSRILEIGSFLGFSTRLLLEGSAAWGARVTAVDPNIRHRDFDSPRDLLLAYNSAHVGKRLEVVTAFLGDRGSSVDWHYKAEIAADPGFRENLFATRPIIGADWERSFELIFIDGDHDYESAQDNFAICERLLAPGGTIVLHDAISWPGVARLMGELARERAHLAEVEVIDAGRVFEHPKVAGEIMKNVDGLGFYRPCRQNLPARAEVGA